ncbi:MAG: 3-phosphoshikimate 1-carboxyvinyltransferase [Ruminococcus sp.]|nr:3-phosphoshikimate 1-carboxyvinyltransferase [Ruminococcus sp.]
MKIKLLPTLLHGEITVPPSKSVAHRFIIAASLAEGRSVISNLQASADILATIECMRALGTKIDFDGERAVIDGIETPAESAELDCCESGSTLRFLVPVACALGTSARFYGKGKLPHRPLTPLLDELPKHEITFDYNGTMPFGISGKLKGGKFFIGGDISSQFITGLLFALPLLNDDSEIVLTSHLQSKPYVDITLGALSEFGIEIKETKNGYFVKGSQHYKPSDTSVEGDYSQAAFFKTANALGSNVNINGLNVNSFQGDKKIVEIIEKIVYNKNGELNPFELDCSDIPDLVPILAVLGSFCNGTSYITNAQRLRIKECDRLAAISECLNKIGGDVRQTEDGLVINGKKQLVGGEVDSFNDHRIAMAMAIAATRCVKPLVINGAEAVRKSYPDFWEDYRSLGSDVQTLEN